MPEGAETFTEEQRSRRPTVFSVLREITAAFGCPDPHLGLYGAFGYDLAFQFEPVRTSIDRSDDQRDLVLHLPDQIWVVDLRREEALRYSYDFTVAGPAGGAGPAGPGLAGPGLASPGLASPGLARHSLHGRPAQGDGGHAGAWPKHHAAAAAARTRPVRGGGGAGEGALPLR